MPIPEPIPKARIFLQDARLCGDHGRYDSAASRAYYAMFRAAMALMEHYGYLRPSWNHSRLQRMLGQRMVDERALLTYSDVEAMNTAYTLRVVADYGNRQVSSQEVQDILATAHRFVAKIEGLINDAAQS